MVETALVPTKEKADFIIPSLSGLTDKQVKALFKIQKKYEDSKDKDRIMSLITAKDAILIRTALLVGLWAFIEYGNMPEQMWWSRDQKGSDFSSTGLQFALVGLLAPEAIEGVAHLIDAILPWPW